MKQSCTRRQALQGAAVLLTGLAGCSGSSSSSGSSSAPETAENVETEPAHYMLRSQDDTPPVRMLPEETRGDETATTANARRRLPDRGLVATRETADRITFADIDGAEEARSFVEGTDFDRETLLLEPDRIGECFKLDLCYITWSATEYHTYYARLYRDVEVACEADARVWAVNLIRIPDTLDPDEVTGSGSGMASGTCYPWERRLERRVEPNASSRKRRHRDAASTDAAGGGQ